MSGCTCKVPRPSSNPRHLTTCVVCGREVLPEWSSANIAPLLDRLKDIPEVKLSEEFDSFRANCISREEDGRQHFGYRFLGRSNEKEAREEISDFANYMLFGVLRRRREGRDDHEDLAFTAIYYAFKCYETICEVERKERGAP